MLKSNYLDAWEVIPRALAQATHMGDDIHRHLGCFVYKTDEAGNLTGVYSAIEIERGGHTFNRVTLEVETVNQAERIET